MIYDIILGHVINGYGCTIDKCGESELDIQYIMGISQVTPTTVWYTEDSWSDWLFQVANASYSPKVMSISYG